MAAESTEISLVNRDQNSLQHSEQGVVAHFSTLIEQQSLEKTQNDLLILLSFLQGLTENVMSGDVMQLAAFRAIDLCEKAGMNSEEVSNRILLMLNLARKNRNKNPISKMF